MKHKAFRWIPAVLLAALLAGCGAKTAASARPDSSRELKSTPPDSMHATAAITEQYTLPKTRVRSTRAITTPTFRASTAGRNWIFAIHPSQA